MVMGPTHAMSGAAGWLAGAAAGLTISGIGVTFSEPIALILGTLVTAGAALGPDIDSHSSTVVNSFGIFGRLTHSIVNAISVSVYNMTRSKYDKPRENGHRTLFHTSFMALLMGGLVFFGSSIKTPSGFSIGDKELLIGQIVTVVVFFIFFHLSLAGLFEKYFTKNRRKYGPYAMMLFSFVITLGIAYIMPEDTSYAWLGVAVAFGWFIHLLGDMITKMGVPMAWPIKIRGYRWWDVTLPSILRIRANGLFEKVILLPALTIITIVLTIVAINNLAGDVVGQTINEVTQEEEANPSTSTPEDSEEEGTGVVRPIED